MPKYISKMLNVETWKSKDGAVSLSYSMLTRENYIVWVMKMKVYMQVHGVWEAVETKDKEKVIEDITN